MNQLEGNVGEKRKEICLSWHLDFFSFSTAKCLEYYNVLIGDFVCFPFFFLQL